MPFDKYGVVPDGAKCAACNGSGYDDVDGSPPCGACDGTGRSSKTIDPVKEAKMMESQTKGERTDDSTEKE